MQCESKKVAGLKLVAIFSLRLSIFLYISVEFCQFVGNLYRLISTNSGGFILILHKILLVVLIMFTISSFEFHHVKLP